MLSKIKNLWFEFIGYMAKAAEMEVRSYQIVSKNIHTYR